MLFILKHFFFGVIPSIMVLAITTIGVSNHLCKTNNYFFCNYIKRLLWWAWQYVYLAGGIIIWLSFGLLLGMAMAWLIRIIFGAEIIKWIDRVLLIVTPFAPVGVAYWLYYSSGNSYGLGMGLGVIVTAFFILSLVGFYITWLAGFTINRVIFGIKQKKELIADTPLDSKIKFLNWWERR